MARLKSAGLNPNLAYGQVQNATMSGITGSMPNAQASPLHAGQIDFTLGSQINQVNSQISLNRTQEEFVKSQIRGQDIKNTFDAYRYLGSKGQKLADLMLDHLQEQVDYSAQSRSNMKVQANLMASEIVLNVAKEHNINADTQLILKKAVIESMMPSYYRSLIRDVDSKISEREANILYIEAMTEKAKKEGMLVQKHVENYDKLTTAEN